MLQIRQVNIAEQRAIQVMNTTIRKDLAEKIAHNSYLTFQQIGADTYASWLTNDIETIQHLGFETLELTLVQVMNVIGSTITLMAYHPSFFITLSFFTILMAAIPKQFSEKMEAATLVPVDGMKTDFIAFKTALLDLMCS